MSLDAGAGDRCPLQSGGVGGISGGRVRATLLAYWGCHLPVAGGGRRSMSYREKGEVCQMHIRVT